MLALFRDLEEVMKSCELCEMAARGEAEPVPTALVLSILSSTPLSVMLAETWYRAVQVWGICPITVLTGGWTVLIWLPSLWFLFTVLKRNVIGAARYAILDGEGSFHIHLTPGSRSHDRAVVRYRIGGYLRGYEVYGRGSAPRVKTWDGKTMTLYDGAWSLTLPLKEAVYFLAYVANPAELFACHKGYVELTAHAKMLDTLYQRSAWPTPEEGVVREILRDDVANAPRTVRALQRDEEARVERLIRERKVEREKLTAR